MTVDVGLAAPGLLPVQDFKAAMAGLEKRMREAAANLEFEEAARYRDELKRVQERALAIAGDPLAKESDLESDSGRLSRAGRYNPVSSLPMSRPHKPGDAEMGPHNFGGGEAGPRGGTANAANPRKLWQKRKALGSHADAHKS